MYELYHDEGCTCDNCMTVMYFTRALDPEQHRRHLIAEQTRTMSEVVRRAAIPTPTHAKWLANYAVKRALGVRGLSPK
jgi:hypothetical protein